MISLSSKDCSDPMANTPPDNLLKKITPFTGYTVDAHSAFLLLTTAFVGPNVMFIS